jgi:hypothetical protein
MQVWSAWFRLYIWKVSAIMTDVKKEDAPYVTKKTMGYIFI